MGKLIVALFALAAFTLAAYGYWKDPRRNPRGRLREGDMTFIVSHEGQPVALIRADRMVRDGRDGVDSALVAANGDTVAYIATGFPGRATVARFVWHEMREFKP